MLFLPSFRHQGDDPDQEEQDYVEGAQLTEEEREALSPTLQAVCEGKDIFWLQPAPATAATEVASK